MNNRVPRIVHRTKDIDHLNPLSGDIYTETVIIPGFEVWGGGCFFMTKHNSLRGAEKERDFRLWMNDNHPFKCPYSVREWKSCKHHGLNSPGLLKDAYDFKENGS